MRIVAEHNTGATPEVLVIDHRGELVEPFVTEPARFAISWANDLAVGSNGGGAVVVADGTDAWRLQLVGPDGKTVETDPLPFDDTYSFFGNRNSLGAAIQIGAEHVVVTLGSSDGPNSRMVVYDLADGSERWSLDDIRPAAIATLGGEDVIVYDERSDAPEDAETTRDLFVVGATDPEDLRWSAPLKVNDLGGNGFLGATNDGLVFAIEDAEGDARGFRSIITVADAESAPDVIVAAEGFGGGRGPTHHVDDQVIAVAVDDRLLTLRPNGQTTTMALDSPIAEVQLVGLHLVVATEIRPDCG